MDLAAFISSAWTCRVLISLIYLCWTVQSQDVESKDSVITFVPDGGGDSVISFIPGQIQPIAGGNAVCWSGDFTFERCCGTLDPKCFGAEFTYEDCCPTEEVVCKDDTVWVTADGTGDCTSYLPGGASEGRCEEDAAAARCLVSCGMCIAGDDSCWSPPDYTFQNCCGGAAGNPACFDGETYTFERCCDLITASPTNLLAPPACLDMPVQPSCAELLAGGYQCARPMTDSNAALDGKTLADVCPASCRVCNTTAEWIPDEQEPLVTPSIQCDTFFVNHGSVQGKPLPGTVYYVWVVCDDGFEVVGDAVRACYLTGRWDTDEPASCVAADGAPAAEPAAAAVGSGH